MSDEKKPAWVFRGKTIRHLIKELQSFENQDLEVRISIDAGDSTHTISLVGKNGGCCVLTSCVDFYEEKMKREQADGTK